MGRTSGEYDVCVRGADHAHYAKLAQEAKGPEALRTGKTLCFQAYGIQMTVRPASKCEREQ